MRSPGGTWVMSGPVALSNQSCSASESGGADAQPAKLAAAAMAPITIAIVFERVTEAPA